MRIKKSCWLLVVVMPLLTVGTVYASPIVIIEDGTDQAVQGFFTFPVGFAAFPISFRSDIGTGFFGETTEDELADVLTVTFPGEAAKFATGESGTVFQLGFQKGSKIDQIAIGEPGLLGGTSDFVALYFDANTQKFAVGFTSCSICIEPPTDVTVPEPAVKVAATAFVKSPAKFRSKLAKSRLPLLTRSPSTSRSSARLTLPLAATVRLLKESPFEVSVPVPSRVTKPPLCEKDPEFVKFPATVRLFAERSRDPKIVRAPSNSALPLNVVPPALAIVRLLMAWAPVVKVPVAPSITTVPFWGTKVPPEIVKLPLTLRLLEFGALKVPPEREKSP